MAKREPLGSMEIAYRQSQKIEQILFNNEGENKMANVETKEVKLENNGEMAIVRVSATGAVEVVRDEAVTTFRPQHTVETVVEKFKSTGWVEKAEPSVPKHIIDEVDEYLELHEKMAKLKAEMEDLKKGIRTYMDKAEIREITGRSGKKVYLQDAKASNSTSRYTDYDLNEVMVALDGTDLLKKVTEIRVNAEKLEGLLKVEKLPKKTVEEVKALKISNPGTPRFAVKK